MSDGPDDEAITVRWIAVSLTIALTVSMLGFASCERKTQSLMLEARLACTGAGGSWVVTTGNNSNGQCLMLVQPQSPEAGTTRPKPNPRYEQP